MKTGDAVVVVTRWDALELIKGTLVKDRSPGAEFLKVDTGREWGVQLYHVASVFPASAENDIRDVLAERVRLSCAYDDSMKLVYELRNKVARGEYS